MDAPSPPPAPTVRDLLAELSQIWSEIQDDGAALFAGWRGGIAREAFLPSAENLALYMAARRRDLRPLQRAMRPWGLSSLGRLEGRVASNFTAVERALEAMLPGAADEPVPVDDFMAGEERLAAAATRLFGPPHTATRQTRVMVTLPPVAAEDTDFLRTLLLAGADAVRVNCSHYDTSIWQAIVENLRTVDAELERHTRILMDLGGPKCRTADIAAPKKQPRMVHGNTLLLARAEAAPDRKTFPFQARCTIASVLDRVAPEQRVYMDDGRLGGSIVAILPEGALVRVEHALPTGTKLKNDKGLNFPDTDLGLDPLTEKDRRDLDFVARHADMIGYSFVQSAADIEVLQAELADRRPHDWQELAVVAKIETPQAVHHLPEIIVAAAGKQPLGVMIARGDLAVEIGFERLAEVQEQILWVCEAAHVPVVWATQVLESLIKQGLPSRGDMTDAAMGARAECIMLNKGPFIAQGLAALTRLLDRMPEHQRKKSSRLHPLHSW